MVNLCIQLAHRTMIGSYVKSKEATESFVVPLVLIIIYIG